MPREEGISRVELQLGCLRNDVEALRGGVEKQLRAMLTTARSTADRKQPLVALFEVSEEQLLYWLFLEMFVEDRSI